MVVICFHLFAVYLALSNIVLIDNKRLTCTKQSTLDRSGHAS